MAEIASTFYYGLLFDISAITYVNLVYIFLHILPFPFRERRGFGISMKILFFISNGISLLLNVIDLAYFRFTNKRTGTELFHLKDDVTNMMGQYIVDFWYLILIFISLIFIMLFFYRKTESIKVSIYTTAGIIKQSIVCLVLFVVFFIAARGTIRERPLIPNDAIRYVNSKLTPALLNTPFQMIHTFYINRIEEVHYFSEDDLIEIYTPRHANAKSLELKKENVVIIILESFGKECMGYFNDFKGYTPFLDSLMKHSLVFTNAYSNGRKSIEAIPAILSSMPTWMNMPYIHSQYRNNKLSSIGALLKSKNYYTAFFHNGRNGTMDFDSYISKTDFGEYFGMSEYPNQQDYDNQWGIYDEPYLQYIAKKLDTIPKPFCVSFFTLSSHHPYKIPKKYSNTFKGGSHPIYKSIEYSDYSLKRFFAAIQYADWFNNTLFVITTDHSSANIVPVYQTEVGKHAIPIIFFKPGDSTFVGKNLKTVQQIDIMPTILDYLGYNDSYFGFGKNMFDSGDNGWGLQYNTGFYQFIYNNHIIHFDGEETFALYDCTKDTFLINNLIGSREPSLETMENKLKAIIQSYNSTVVRNQTN